MLLMYTARGCYDPLTLCNYPRPAVSSTWTTTHNIQPGRNSATGNTTEQHIPSYVMLC